MENKQTAVEWLIEKLKSQGLLIGEPDNLVAVREAKEMEKQQIENAYQAGQDNVDYTASFVDENGLEDYYQKTYGGNI